MTGTPVAHAGRAEQVIALLSGRGESIAIAESLTGGMLCSALVDVPGASAVVQGGIVSYTNAVKTHLLGVDGPTLEREGAVSADVALEMARGVRGVLSIAGANWGVSTTGVAGPDPDPRTATAPGVVFVAVVGPHGQQWSQRLELSGDRAAIRQASVDFALGLILQAVASVASGE